MYERISKNITVLYKSTGKRREAILEPNVVKRRIKKLLRE